MFTSPHTSALCLVYNLRLLDLGWNPPFNLRSFPVLRSVASISSFGQLIISVGFRTVGTCLTLYRYLAAAVFLAASLWVPFYHKVFLAVLTCYILVRPSHFWWSDSTIYVWARSWSWRTRLCHPFQKINTVFLTATLLWWGPQYWVYILFSLFLLCWFSTFYFFFHLIYLKTHACESLFFSLSFPSVFFCSQTSTPLVVNTLACIRYTVRARAKVGAFTEET